MEKEKERGLNELRQQKLSFGAVREPQEFTRAGVLEAVAKLIATNDQVRNQYVIYERKNTFKHTGRP